MIRCLVAFALLSSLAAGQQEAAASKKLTARSFLPENYQTVLFIDLDAVREQGVWEEIETSVLKVLLGRLEKKWGFGFDDLDKVWGYADVEDGRPRNLFLYEGNKPLKLSSNPAPGEAYEDIEVGRYKALLEDHFQGPILHVLPHDKLLVLGEETLVRPVLEGKPSTGLPAPDVMSLLSGRGENLLYLIFHLGDQAVGTLLLPQLFPGAEWEDGEQPTHLMLRLRTTGDEDDPHVQLQAIMRHAEGSKGSGI